MFSLLTYLTCSSRPGDYWSSDVSLRTAVTLGQYSPVRPSRTVGKKSVIKAFGWYFFLRDFVSKATYLAKLKQNQDLELWWNYHTAIFLQISSEGERDWRNQRYEWVCTTILFRKGINSLLEVFLKISKVQCYINSRVSFKSITCTITVTKKISFYSECFRNEIYYFYMFWKSFGF